VDCCLKIDNFRIIGFIDCKIVETCWLGSGQAEDNAEAPPHEDADLIQESVYSGYMRCHGLKILNITLLNGLIGALYGAISTRENDNGTLSLSNLSIDMMHLQPEVMQGRQNGEDMLYYSIYGDAIFPLLNCITGYHRQPLQGELTDREEAENFSMQKSRTSAEWLDETTTNLFQLLESKYNRHLLDHNHDPNLV
jgi:hypothetical protein